jgi:hypothetical protein
MWKKLTSRFARDRRARSEGEYDAPTDTGQSTGRPTAGEESPYVGRAGGDETGDPGESGAQARGDSDLDHQGAARPD